MSYGQNILLTCVNYMYYFGMNIFICKTSNLYCIHNIICSKIKIINDIIINGFDLMWCPNWIITTIEHLNKWKQRKYGKQSGFINQNTKNKTLYEPVMINLLIGWLFMISYDKWTSIYMLSSGMDGYDYLTPNKFIISPQE